MLRISLSATLCFALASSTSLGQGQPKENNFIPLFNGKNLDGWSGNKKYFRAEDGAIIAGSLKEKIPNNEFLTHSREFGDFELQLKAKLVGKGGNAGIQIRSRRPTKAEIASKDKATHLPAHEMYGYQVDMGKAWDSIWWGKLYDESRRRKVLAGPDDEEQLEKLVRFDDWNDYRIVAHGKRIQIWLNGTKTVDYVEKEDDIAGKGLIGLQIHSGPPSEASYKEIRIREIK